MGVFCFGKELSGQLSASLGKRMSNISHDRVLGADLLGAKVHMGRLVVITT